MFYLKNLKKHSMIRLFSGAFLILIACIIGLWNYTTQDINVNKNKDCNICNQAIQESIKKSSEFIDERLDIKRGDNFTTVLFRADISKNQTYSAIEALKKVFNPRDIRTDHKIFITYKPTSPKLMTKDLMRIVIKLSLDQEVVIEQNDVGIFKARLDKKDLTHEYRHAEGIIENSLYVDAVKKGAHPKIIHNMIQAFSYDVDFQRSFKRGDEYSLLFDFHKDPDSMQEKPGDLLYASLTLQGKKICIYRHKPKNGTTQYFNEKGESVKKGLLRTPVDGARISSGFGRRRHPILGFTKVHKGVDFAAPKGTPIMASGSGKVVRIGRWGNYGNYIRIKHNSKYSTAYAHLCRYAKGLRIGSSVRQGQIIGYVGCTGRATGNHLHYELLANGKHINPKHIKMMPAGKLKGKELIHFLANKEKLEQRLDLLRNSNITQPDEAKTLASKETHKKTI